MWGRRNTQDTGASGAGARSSRASDAPRALSTLDELLRHADWEGMTQSERDMLLAPVQGIQPPLFADGAALPDRDAERQLQDWVAQLVGTRFQPEVAGVVRAWIENGAPDGHLYVGGRVGQGRTSIVASLARQAMLARPIPPDYCYVPDVAAMARHALLPVPKGTGSEFGRTLSNAIGQIAQSWDSAGASADSSGNPPGDASAVPQDAQPTPPVIPPLVIRLQAIAAAFDGLGAATSDAARDYLTQLRAAFEGLAATGKPLPFEGDEPPVAHVTPSADDLPGAPPDMGAPVVVASLSQSELTDVLLRANGGVLVLQTVDLLDANIFSSLASALRARGLSLKAGWPLLPLSVRVVLVGTDGAYHTLQNNTEDFSRLFRYEAWCNSDVAWTRETESAYAALADGVAVRYGLPKFDSTGVGRLVEEAARRSNGLNRTRLSTNLLLLHDLAVEAARRGQGARCGADQRRGCGRHAGATAGVAERHRAARPRGDPHWARPHADRRDGHWPDQRSRHPRSAPRRERFRRADTPQRHCQRRARAAGRRYRARGRAGRCRPCARSADGGGLPRLALWPVRPDQPCRAHPVRAASRLDRRRQRLGGGVVCAALRAGAGALATFAGRHRRRRAYGEIQPIGGVNTKSSASTRSARRGVPRMRRRRAATAC